jgi:hypothetical protein
MVKKPKPIKVTRQISFFVNDKIEVKLKKIMKKLKLKTVSETIRTCIEKF